MPVDLIIDAIDARSARGDVEVVERKGLGHPDTLCDAIAERISIELSRHYLQRFGQILHHNVDKVLLCGGAARPAFGGGEIREPIEIYLAGRATEQVGDASVPIHEIAIAACREVLRRHVPALADEHVRVFSRIRPGSLDLTRLFARGRAVPLANDSSCGAGFAPLSGLERVVLQLEQRLNSAETKAAHPAIGSDVKVMGVRRGDAVALTVSCAFIGRHLASIGEYAAAKELVRTLALSSAKEAAAIEPQVGVNVADDLESGSVFLTVSGTSAEAGDDGEVGRGNRANGLITPYRPMTMEAPCGKNPVSHVGKLYQVLANRIANALVGQLADGSGAECWLVSQIGQPIDEPQIAHVRLLGARSAITPATRALAEEVIRAELGRLPNLREELVAGRVTLY